MRGHHIQSTSKRLAELAIPKSTVQKHFDLKLHPYRPTFILELRYTDLNRTQDEFERMVQTIQKIPKCGMVTLSDECAVNRSCRSRNYVFWYKKDPHYFEELEHNSPNFTIWAGMKSEQHFGAYLFDGPDIHHIHLDMLQNWFLPQMKKKNLGIKDDVSFQQQGALLHYALVKFSGNTVMVLGHQCCSPHLPRHLEDQTCHRVKISCGVC